MKKLLLSLIVSVISILVIATLSFASGKGGEVVEGGEPWEGKKIGCSVPNTAWPWISVFCNTLEETAKKYGMETIIVSAESDEVKQINDMGDLIVKKVDFIDIIPIGPTAVVTPTKKAYEAGIPVLFSQDIPDEEALKHSVGYSGKDDWETARIAAREMAKKLNNKGKIVMLQGFPGQPAEIARTEGFEEELAKIAPDIKIVDKQPYDWDPAKAQAITEDFLTKYPDIDGMWIHDDNAAAAAGQIVKQHGYKKGEIIIIGTGGSKNGISAIKEGIIYGTVDQSPVTAAELDVELIVKYFKEGELPKWNHCPLPFYTAENVGDYEGVW
jgi:ribose transport system substrate-binding protein